MKNLVLTVLLASSACSTGERHVDHLQSDRGGSQPTVFQPKDYPFQTKSLHLDGIGEMHYLDEGNADGEALMLLHGNPTWSYLWRNSVPLLGKQFRVIAPDLIGHGRSPHIEAVDPFRLNLRAIEQLIVRLKLKKVTLIGHDWGGTIAFVLASKLPAVTSVILCEPVLPRLRRQLGFMTRTFRGTSIIEWYMRFMDVFVSSVADDLQAEKSETKRIIENYRRPFSEKGNEKIQIAWWNALPVADEDLNDNYHFLVEEWNRFKATSVPKLVIYGDPGMTVAPKDVPRLEREMNETSFIRVGEGIHFFPEKYPVQFAQIISDWKAKTAYALRD